MSLPSINFLHLTVSETLPGQTFSSRPPANLATYPVSILAATVSDLQGLLSLATAHLRGPRLN